MRITFESETAGCPPSVGEGAVRAEAVIQGETQTVSLSNEAFPDWIRIGDCQASTFLHLGVLACGSFFTVSAVIFDIFTGTTTTPIPVTTPAATVSYRSYTTK